jgi:hypothetical protein
MTKGQGRVIMHRISFLLVLIALLFAPVLSFADEPPVPGPIGVELPMAAISAAPPKVLFSDDFKTNQAGWSTRSDDTVKRFISGNAYHIAVYKPDLMVSSTVPASSKFSDFVLQADAAMTAGPEASAYGVAIRVQDSQNYYVFALTGSNEFRMDKVKDLKYTSTNKNEPIPAGVLRSKSTANTMKIVAKGKILEFYLNDIKVATKNDDAYATGSIFLFASSPADLAGTEATFSNLTIWDAGAATPSPTPAPPATITPIPRGKLLFEDEFLGYSEGWTEENGDGYSYWLDLDGTYHISVSKVNMIAWSNVPGQYGDFVLEMENGAIEGAANSEAGILFRIKDKDNYYRFGTSGSGSFTFVKRQAGSWTTLIPWTLSNALYEGKGHADISIIAKGSTFTFYGNGVKLASYTESTFASGGAALYAGSLEKPTPVEVQFEYIGIWEAAGASVLPSPTTTPSTPARRTAKTLFSEDFTNNVAGWTTTSTQDYSKSISNGAYHIAVTKAGYMVWSAVPISQTTDFVVQFDTSVSSSVGNAATGLLFRYQDSDNYYQFVLNNAGAFSIYLVKKGEEINLSPALNTPAVVRTGGASNTVRIVAKGSLFDLYVNGTKVGSFTDATFSSGMLSYFTVNPNSSRSAEGTLSKVRVWDSIPD